MSGGEKQGASVLEISEFIEISWPLRLSYTCLYRHSPRPPCLRKDSQVGCGQGEARDLNFGTRYERVDSLD